MPEDFKYMENDFIDLCKLLTYKEKEKKFLKIWKDLLVCNCLHAKKQSKNSPA